MKRSIGLDFIISITIFAPKPYVIRDTPYGKRIIANVDGGHFEGTNIKGTVQPPSGDWLLSRADNSAQLDVRVSLVTDDKTLIYIELPRLAGRSAFSS